MFTSLFALEMLLKLLVYGPFGYIKNPYNIFDGVIVVIRYDCPSAPSCLRNALRVAWGEEPHTLFLWAWNQAPLTQRPPAPLAGDSLCPSQRIPHSLSALPCSHRMWSSICFGQAPLKSLLSFPLLVLDPMQVWGGQRLGSWLWSRVGGGVRPSQLSLLTKCLETVAHAGNLL